MRYELQHPDEERVQAAYGWDRAIGFFVQVERDGEVVEEYDALHPGYDDLKGAIPFLVEHEFFDEDDVFEAMDLMKIMISDEMEGSMRVCAEVIENFKSAAD